MKINGLIVMTIPCARSIFRALHAANTIGILTDDEQETLAMIRQALQDADNERPRGWVELN